MKRPNKTLFTALAAVLFSLPLIDAYAASGEQKGKADPIQSMMENYFVIGQTLSRDSFKGTSKSAQKIVEAATQILKEKKQNSAEKKDYFAQVKNIQGAAQKFTAQDLKSSRENYQALSQAVLVFVKTNGYSGTAYSFHCPMVQQTWLQSVPRIANPFYGSEMLRCGKMTGKMVDGKLKQESDS